MSVARVAARRRGVVIRSLGVAATAALFVGVVPTSVALGATATRPVPAVALTIRHHPLPGQTTVASTLRRIFGYARPGGRPVGIVAPTWHGAPLVMPVLRIVPGYAKVRLPGRPNGSTIWIHTFRLLMSVTPYHIVINLKTTHLQLIKYGKVILNAPVGVGTAQYPTPVGNFFVAFYAAPPSSGYGPFVMVTSAHSNVITDWESSGDAMVAIHGPLGAGPAIGSTGAHVSHGCIRMHVYQQQQLSVVSIGSPITIEN
jgi:L,D-transpeptidase-like protein